jgi:hypothetical protein
MGDLHYPIPMRIIQLLQICFDSLLHDAAASQTSDSNNSMSLKQKKTSGNESGIQLGISDGKTVCQNLLLLSLYMLRA